MKSVREIAKIMDPLDPPTGLRDLNNRHRWLNGNQSLREIFNRHNSPQTKYIRFLSYNTYLLKYSLGAINEAAAGAATGALLGAIFGGPVGAFLGGAVGGAAGAIDGAIDGGTSLIDTPATDKRPQEIGERLASEGYDIMALCEVWQNEFKQQIIKAWPTNLAIREGGEPDDPEQGLGSGLLVISPTYQLRSIPPLGFYQYDEKGDGKRDADWWSNKGILTTRVDVGYGCIDIYSTHLFSGGSLSGTPNPQEIADIQRKELDQLKAIVNLGRMISPQNVVIITGDFNIDARETDDSINPAYKHLEDFMSACNVEDVWQRHWGVRGDIINGVYDSKGGYDNKGNCGGYTNNQHEDTGEHVASQISNSMEKVCKQEDGKDSSYCAEPAPCWELPQNYDESPHRIDFIFLERPSEAHTFNLDVTRIRRRSFKREVSTDGMDYLSDHLGLDVTLVVSPR